MVRRQFACLLLFAAAAFGQQVCPPVNFLNAPEFPPVSLSDTAGLLRETDGSMTELEVLSYSPYTVQREVPDAQALLATCFPLPAYSGKKQTAPVSQASKHGDAVNLPGGNHVLIAFLRYSVTIPDVVVADRATRTTVSETHPPAGVFAASLLLTDVNKDGKADLVVADRGNNDGTQSGVSVLLGNGDGTFQSAVQYATDKASYSVTAADFNGDGNIDLAVANGDSGDVSVLIGTGGGKFAAAVNYPVITGSQGTAPLSIAAGDINKDGKLDLVVIDNGSGDIAVLPGSGNGTFGAPVFTSIGGNPNFIALADFNGDGKLDAAVTKFESATVEVWLGKGDGTFGNARAYIGPPAPTYLTITDVNGDGALDIAVGNGSEVGLQGNPLTILFGRGDGTFAAAPLTPVPQISATSLAIADFNGDGHPDAAVAGQHSTSQFATLLGQAGGTFSAPQFVDVSDNGNGVESPVLTSGDFDGDGKPDIVVAGESASNLSTAGALAFFKGNGDGTFAAPVVSDAGAPPVQAITAADLNKDHKVDLVYGSSGQLSIALGAGNGTFSAPTNAGSPENPVAIAVADLNGDGVADIAVADGGTIGSSAGGVQIYLGKGDGSFSNPATVTVGQNPTTIAVGDVNGDGKADLIVPTGTATVGVWQMAVLLGNGNGTFQAPRFFATDFGPASIAIADYNNDGKPDIVVAHCCGDTDMTVMAGNGDGTFQPEQHFNGGPSPNTVGIADINGDKIPDLVVGGARAVAALVNVTPTFRNVSAASFQTIPLAAESIAAAFGPNVANVKSALADKIPLPTNLGGTTVTVKDVAGVTREAGLFYAGTGQVNYEVPPGTAAGPATVTVTSGSGTTTKGTIVISSVSPGIFALNTSNLAAAIVIRVKPGNVQSSENVYQVSKGAVIAQPISLGAATDKVYLELFSTGIRGRSALSAVKVTVGGYTVPVQYAGAASGFVGLDQINAGPLPRALAGAGSVEVTVTVDGSVANTTNLTIQ